MSPGTHNCKPNAGIQLRENEKDLTELLSRVRTLEKAAKQTNARLKLVAKALIVTRQQLPFIKSNAKMDTNTLKLAGWSYSKLEDLKVISKGVAIATLEKHGRITSIQANEALQKLTGTQTIGDIHLSS